MYNDSLKLTISRTANGVRVMVKLRENDQDTDSEFLEHRFVHEYDEEGILVRRGESNLMPLLAEIQRLYPDLNIA